MFIRIPTGTTSRLTTVDHKESYGRYILEKILKGLNVSMCVDLGCGSGEDLMIVKKYNPYATCVGVDYGLWNKEQLSQNGIDSISVNIENQKLPFESESVDFVIANQVFEHIKEVYWVNHEIFRCLRAGGFLYIGVPNVLSLHNRILGLFGTHPTCSKMISAHVRVFSKKDTILFYRETANSFTTIENFYGAQFYPFPRIIARPLATLFPTLAVTIFFLIRKTENYSGQFIEWLSINKLETNFFRGFNA